MGESAKSRPLASVALHYAESPAALASVTDYIKQYISKELHKHGITLEAYMSMPGSVAKDLILEIELKQEKEGSALKATLAGK